MKNLEIEKKYLVKINKIPNLSKYKKVDIAQGFIYLKPCIRVRKAGNEYFITIKNKAPKKYGKNGDLVRTELETKISKEAYKDLFKLCKGNVIEKTRYYIPYKKHMIELDVFRKKFKGLIYAEVEFKNLKEASRFVAPDWFYRDVTCVEKFKNTSLSKTKNFNFYKKICR